MVTSGAELPSTLQEEHWPGDGESWEEEKMKLKGEGYAVGPNYETKGSMRFELGGLTDLFSLRVLEDRPFEIEDKVRRAENSVEISLEQLQELGRYIAKLVKTRTDFEKNRR